MGVTRGPAPEHIIFPSETDSQQSRSKECCLQAECRNPTEAERRSAENPGEAEGRRKEASERLRGGREDGGGTPERENCLCQILGVGRLLQGVEKRQSIKV